MSFLYHTIMRKQLVCVVSATATGLSCENPVGVVCGRCTNDDNSGDGKCYGCKCADGYFQRRSGTSMKCITRRLRNGTVTTRWRGRLQCESMSKSVVSCSCA